MKGRSFVIILCASIIILLFVGVGSWKSGNREINISNELPLLAKYIPNDSDISVYFNFNPNKLSKYINFSSKIKNNN